MTSKYFKTVALSLTFIASLACLYLAIFQMGFFTESPGKPLPFAPPPEQKEKNNIWLTLPKISPRTFAMAPDSSFWVAGEGHLYHFSKEKKVIKQIPLSEEILNLAPVSGNTLYGSTENRIVKINFSKPEEEITRWAPLENKPLITGLCLSGQRIFIADAGNKKLHCYTLEGKALWSISGKENFIVPSPYFDVAPDGDGGVWIANPGLKRIENYNKEGRYLGMWEPVEKEKFLGCCNPSQIALLPEGKFVTLEKGFPRCRVFSPAGHVLQVVARKESFSPGEFNFKLAIHDQSILILDPRKETLYHFPLQELKK